MDDELLSAYVDGELSKTELAAVEARLRHDPQARTLLDELRAVSSTLRAMPRHKLGIDLREAVLQQELVHPHSLLEETEEGSDRRWVWAVMAIAAAFFLAVYMPNSEQGQRQVAQVEAKRRDAVQAAPHLVGPIERPREPMEIVADGVLSASAPRNEAPAEAYEVHLLPGGPAVSPADFDELLATHGIAVRNASDADGSGGPELVLVEAPLADIQQIVAACAADGLRWKSLRIVGQYELDNKLALLADLGPEERGVAVAMEGLDLEGGSAEMDAATGKAETGSAAALPTTIPTRGWATHLGRGASAAIPTSPDPQLAATRASMVRVLFIVHPAAE